MKPIEGGRERNITDKVPPEDLQNFGKKIINLNLPSVSIR
jgi:hypothetical protein